MFLLHKSAMPMPVIVTKLESIIDTEERDRMAKTKPEKLEGVPTVLVCHYYDKTMYVWVDQPHYDLCCYGLHTQFKALIPASKDKEVYEQAWVRVEEQWKQTSWAEQDRQMGRYACVEGLEARMREIQRLRAG